MNSSEVTEVLATIADRYGIEITAPRAWIHSLQRDNPQRIVEAAELWCSRETRPPKIADLRQLAHERATDHTAKTSLAECRRILETAKGPVEV